MINYILIPFLSLILIVFQTMVSDIVLFGKIGVELSLILVIYLGFRLDIIRGGVLSLIIGFLRDCITFSISGLSTLLYVIIFLISLLASYRISPEKSVFIMIFTLICALFEGMIIALFYPLLYGQGVSPHTLLYYIPQALIVSGLSPVLFRAFNRVEVVLNGRDAWPVKRA
ncbi:MAG TPA: hypothetical protein VMT12_13200 [Syntrophales bacterium]|nr:hypothetical protein [Syntrophales bacterium]